MSSTQQQIGNCPNCGLPVNPGSRFCMNCAYDISRAAELPPTLIFTPTSQQVACPNCGASVGAEATFCGNCGATLRAVTNVKKYLLIGGIAFLILALAGVGVWYFFLSGGGIPVSFTEKLLATMPSDLRVENYNVEFSLDGTRAAYIAKKEG